MKYKYKLLFFLLLLCYGDVVLAACTGMLRIQPGYSGHSYSFDSSIAPNTPVSRYFVEIGEKIVCDADQVGWDGKRYAQLYLYTSTPSCRNSADGGVIYGSNIPGLTWHFPQGIPYNCLSGAIAISGIKYADKDSKVTWNVGELRYEIFLKQDNNFDFSKSRTLSVNSISGRGGLGEDRSVIVPLSGSSFNYTYTNIATCTLTAPSEIDFNTVTTSDIIKGTINRDLNVRAVCRNRGASLGLNFKFEPQHKDISANKLGVFYAINASGSLAYKLTKKADSSAIPLNEFIQLVGKDNVNVNVSNTIPLSLTLQKGGGKIATGKVDTFLNITMEHM
ncbi:protein fanF [Salmonella enterica subsp. diarizonae]|nr:protein fanF [Salmonella enterica subsp. diarizonae]EDV3465789.1 protein fanF [Salmonella enterica subsp. diarizonae]